MASGLAVSRVVNVTVDIAPIAAPTRNFGAAVHIGVTDVIDTTERLRSYSNIEDVGGDFGTTDPEYIAAALHFSQAPQPSILYIGRWAQTATKGRLNGGALTASEQLLANWTAITAGAFKIDIDGTTKSLSGLNFSSALNLPGVAAVIDTALSGGSVTWDANAGRFIVKSDTTGASSTVGYAVSPTSGTDISTLLKLNDGAASPPVVGIVAETLADCVAALADKSGDWYAAVVLPGVTNSVALAASAVVEAFSRKRIIGYTIQSTTVLDGAHTDDLASVLKAGGYSRSWCQYSSSSAYAAASFFARASTVDFDADNSTITLKFKTEPGVAAETITATQANTLAAKNCNVFVNYDNGTAIIEEGKMSSGVFFDERHGLDWFENALQTAIWNLLRSSKKVPQTDAGATRLIAVAEKVCAQAVTNGLFAPGVWNGDNIGKLKSGETMPTGFYVYAQPVSAQSQGNREARQSVPVQIAAKGAGAVHGVDLVVTFNR